MNNLFRVLSTSETRVDAAPSVDLRLLLNAVKDARKQHQADKLSDSFYESLEAFLHDLRTVTMDNRDAEPFLKPVAKTEAPDYYEVIQHPMDLGTMLKKVRSKSYKSKREFQDDLDLIWNNCYTYNATPSHPLRVCALRLKDKADKLLRHITDRKDRLEPPIPDALVRADGVKPMANGFHHLAPSPSPSPIPNGVVANGFHRSPSPVKPIPGKAVPVRREAKPKPTTFGDTPALVRTPAGMASFTALEGQAEPSLDAYLSPDESDSEDGGSSMDVDVGKKRKFPGQASGRPRKRSRLRTEPALRDAWWRAAGSDALLANGVPPTRVAQEPPVAAIRDPPRTKKRKARGETLLTFMDDNIRTMRRVRRAHTRLAVLKESQGQGEEAADGEAGPSGSGAGAGPSAGVVPPMEEDIGPEVDGKGKRQRRWMPELAEPLPPDGDIEVGAEAAEQCLGWMSGKVLEHVGFQGTSKVAMSVLQSVASEYLLNVGRTIRFMCDRYGHSMSAEEIVLHTLFESGTTRIQDLERYVTDDVVRHGTRMGELEKKLDAAYAEATVGEALDDDALFGSEKDEAEEGAFVMGNFTDALGEDFLGLRELGIADEFGLTSLNVPKKLLRGKNKAELAAAAAERARAKEPPLPYPLPPPFLPLDARTVDDQIGLLRPFYQRRLQALAPPPPLPPPPYGALPPPLPPPVLADDPPDAAQTKMSPLGQVTKPGAGGGGKKKAKGKEREPKEEPAGSPAEMMVDGPASPEAAKKKKAGAGGGSAGKKKGKMPAMDTGSGPPPPPPMVMASA